MYFYIDVFKMIMNPHALGVEGHFGKIHLPLAQVEKGLPLPAYYSTVTSYYDHYKDLIWEVLRRDLKTAYEEYKDNLYHGESHQYTAHSISIQQPTISTLRYTENSEETQSTHATIIKFELDLELTRHFPRESIALLSARMGSNVINMLSYIKEENQKYTVSIPFSTPHYNKVKHLFSDHTSWQIVSILNLIKTRYLFKAIFNAKDGPCMPSILKATTNYKNDPKAIILKQRIVTKIKQNQASSLNDKQQQLINDFLDDMDTPGVTVLQGPPGTGKSTVIASLIHALRKTNGPRVIVTAATNKAVQQLAIKFYRQSAKNLLFICSEDNHNPFLKSIDYRTWYQTLLESLERLLQYHQDIANTNESDTIQLLKKNKTMIAGLLKEIDEKIASLSLLSDKLDVTFIRQWDELLQTTPTSNLAIQSTLAAMKTIIEQNLIILSDPSLEEKTNEALLEQPSFILCATTIKLGATWCLKHLISVDLVVVDEASLIPEAESLIFLQYTPRKLLLVGDHKQLSPVVKSQLAIKKNYHWSLMERLVVVNSAKHYMLTEQYRMPEEICRWASGQFYQSQLTTPDVNTAPPLKDDSPAQDELAIPNIPLVFYDVKASVENYGKEANLIEAHTAILLATQLRTRYPSASICIICTYQKQVAYLSKTTPSAINVSIGTIDAYQGSECDFVIISFVRSNNEKNIGFLDNACRLNVAVTRATRQLLMVGDASTLQVDPNFSALIAYAQMLMLLSEMKHLAITSHQSSPLVTLEASFLALQEMLESEGAIVLNEDSAFKNLCRHYFLSIKQNQVETIQLILQTLGLIKLAGLLTQNQVIASLMYFNQECVKKDANQARVFEFLTAIEQSIKTIAMRTALDTDRTALIAFLNETDHKNTMDQDVLIRSLYGCMWLIERGLLNDVSLQKVWQKLESLPNKSFHISFKKHEQFTQNIASILTPLQIPAIDTTVHQKSLFSSKNKTKRDRYSHKSNNRTTPPMLHNLFSKSMSPVDKQSGVGLEAQDALSNNSITNFSLFSSGATKELETNKNTPTTEEPTSQRPLALQQKRTQLEAQVISSSTPQDLTKNLEQLGSWSQKNRWPLSNTSNISILNTLKNHIQNMNLQEIVLSITAITILKCQWKDYPSQIQATIFSVLKKELAQPTPNHADLNTLLSVLEALDIDHQPLSPPLKKILTQTKEVVASQLLERLVI